MGYRSKDTKDPDRLIWAYLNNNNKKFTEKTSNRFIHNFTKSGIKQRYFNSL